MVIKQGLSTVAVASLALANASCCPPFCRPTVPDPCGQAIATTTQADAAAVGELLLSQEEPGSRFQIMFQGRDGRLSPAAPADVIGTAFQMTLVGRAGQPSPGLDPIPLMGNYFVLQYNVPARRCSTPTRVDWSVHPEVVFPTGYLFFPRSGSGVLRVLINAFVDPVGVLDLSTNRATTLARADAELAEVLRSDRGVRWQDDRNNAGPVFVSRRLEGSYTVLPGTASRVFVTARAEYWLDAGARACTGCTREIRSLLEAGQFLGLSPGAGARDKGLFGPDFVFSPIR
jgi:hypothetical protein